MQRNQQAANQAQETASIFTTPPVVPESGVPRADQPLHITPEIAQHIAEEALNKALDQQRTAEANGAEGLPRYDQTALTEELRRL